MFEFRPDMIDEDDAEADDTRYAKEDDEEDDEEQQVKHKRIYIYPLNSQQTFSKRLYHTALYHFRQILRAFLDKDRTILFEEHIAVMNARVSLLSELLLIPPSQVDTTVFQDIDLSRFVPQEVDNKVGITVASMDRFTSRNKSQPTAEDGEKVYDC